jgi:putative heme-binding domain-containing protein
MHTHTRYGPAIALVACALLVQHTGAQAPTPPAPATRFTTLPGFVVERVTPADRTTDSCVNMTFDSLGRPVLSKEGGGPRTLFDTNGDGIYDSEIVFSDAVRDCQGLWFDGRTLYGVCVGPADKQMGLYRMTDDDGDDVADNVEHVSTLNGGTGGHGPHAIRRGPDGYPTLMLGNMSRVPDEMVDPLSPLQRTREAQLLERYADARGHAVDVMAPGGTIVRLDRDRNTYTVVTGGFRNPYDLAFNLTGETFTFDADMEWDINLPWYREVRSVHAVQGADYGWRHGSGKLPDYYLDTLPPVREVGRGSPVGVEFYHSFGYPGEFYDNFFEGDWARGRILYTAVKRKGATYEMRPDAAEFVSGEPLNVTDLEVGPDGMIYFCTGGWTTEGGLYRVRYTGDRGVNSQLPTPPPPRAGMRARFGEASPELVAFFDTRPAAAGNSQSALNRAADGSAAAAQSRRTDVLAIVRQPQPLSSWGWAALEHARTSIGAGWTVTLERLARDAAADPRDREQAILMLQRHGDPPGADLLHALVADADAQVRAAAVYVAGVQSNDAARAVAASALKDVDPFVRRRAAEALVRQGLSPGGPSYAPVADIYALLNDPDRFVRYAGRLALERTPRPTWADRVLREANPLGAIEGMYALVRTATSDADLQPIIERQLAMLKRSDLPVDDSLRLLRAFQLTAMEATGGASPDVRRQVHELLSARFPADDERWNREAALTLAYCGQPEAIRLILAAMPPGDTNQPLQIHYASALRAIESGWGVEERARLMDWYERAATWRGGASFSGYLNLLFDSTVARLDEDEKTGAYARFLQFAPLTLAELDARRSRDQGLPAAVARSRGVETVTREEILEYQIFVPTRHRPSADAGRTHFEQLCAACHVFGTLGTTVGPDLTTITSRFTKKDILSKVLWPSRAISDPDQYATTIVELTDGRILDGLVVREDDHTLVLRTAAIVDRPVEIAKSLIRARARSEVSMMPEGLIDALSQEQIADLLAFLLAGPRGDPASGETRRE